MVIESSGPPIHLASRVLVFANSVVRSTGGVARPAYPVEIGDETLVAPLCALTGCTVGPLCYVATGVVVLQGASIGEGSRIAVGAIVHAGAKLPANSRVGMRHFAVPGHPDAVITANLDEAREAIRRSDFFDAAFGVEQDAGTLHREVIRKLLGEVGEWSDQIERGE